MTNFKAYNNYNSKNAFFIFLSARNIKSPNNKDNRLKIIIMPNIHAYNKFITTAVEKKVRTLRLSRITSGNGPIKWHKKWSILYRR